MVFKLTPGTMRPYSSCLRTSAKHLCCRELLNGQPLNACLNCCSNIHNGGYTKMIPDVLEIRDLNVLALKHDTTSPPYPSMRAAIFHHYQTLLV